MSFGSNIPYCRFRVIYSEGWLKLARLGPSRQSVEGFDWTPYRFGPSPTGSPRSQERRSNSRTMCNVPASRESAENPETRKTPYGCVHLCEVGLAAIPSIAKAVTA